MLLLALGSGLWVVTRQPAGRADLLVWVFAESHARMYRGDGAASLARIYQQQRGKSVEVDLLALRALDVRLLSLLMSPGNRRQMPDLVEVEISSVGKYLRPAVDQIGFLPLNAYLEESGLMDRVLRQRFAPWSKHGVIFGVPHDVHPVTLTYRRDLFQQAGVELDSVRTWAEFQDKCLAYQAYWRSRGQERRRAIALSSTSADDLAVMLLQRQVNLVDDDLRLHLTDPRLAATLAFYTQLVAGPRRISANPSAGALWTRDLSRGDVAAVITPDWRVADLRTYAPELAGKLAMMPLPVFAEGDAPTSTWGGTMIGIPRACPDPQAAWDLLQFLYFSPEGLQARRTYSTILPPDRAQWADPTWHQPDPFFGGQRIGELYVQLAKRIPRRYVTPFTAMATSYLSVVLSAAVDRVEAHGTQGLEDHCRQWLQEAEDRLQQQVEFGKVDQ